VLGTGKDRRGFRRLLGHADRLAFSYASRRRGFGALGGSLVDVGIDDQEMKTQANDALKPGTVGLFLLIRKMTTDKALEDLKGVGGTVIRTSFDHAKENALQLWRVRSH
jgi:uncharacterized membrane protein